jgi:hypothetical protein
MPSVVAIGLLFETLDPHGFRAMHPGGTGLKLLSEPSVLKDVSFLARDGLLRATHHREPGRVLFDLILGLLDHRSGQVITYIEHVRRRHATQRMPLAQVGIDSNAQQLPLITYRGAACTAGAAHCGSGGW